MQTLCRTALRPRRRIVITVTLCSIGRLLAVFSFASSPPPSPGTVALSKLPSAAPANHIVARSSLRGTTPTTSASSNSAGWSVIASPNANTNLTELYRLTCVSETECWAIGDYYDSTGTSRTLIEEWNGTSWIIFPSGNASSYDNSLNAVGCESATQCWAVGYYYDADRIAGRSHSLMEKWDGTSWLVVALPSPSLSENLGDELSAVTCRAEGDCWAAGDWSYNVDNEFGSWVAQQPFILHWDGTSWSVVPAPSTSDEDIDYIYGLSCAAPNDCWAAGNSAKHESPQALQTLVERWNGTNWSIVSSPNQPGAISNYYNDLICISADDCWSVGAYVVSISGGTTHKYAQFQHWDGTSWSIVDAINPSAAENTLIGVGCTSTNNCWAVGRSGADSRHTQTLIEYWDGSGWSLVSSPTTGTMDQLNNVTCISPSQCWAVGFSHSGSVTRTMIEEYSLTTPALLNVASRVTHNGAGPFDVTLSLIGNPRIEPRNTAGNYSVVFTFVNDVPNCGTPGTSGGSVINGPNTNQCTENVAGVANGQYINVGLNNVIDSQNNTGSVSVPMGMLIGDVSGNGVVDSGDVFLVRQQSGHAANASNFRADINASGLIDSGDVFLTRQKTSTSLPPHP